MSDPTIAPIDNPTPKPLTKLQIAEARIAELEAELAPFRHQAELDAARAEDVRKGREAGRAPKPLGQIIIFDLDSPEDVLERATAVRRGQIPVDRARRFKTDAHCRVPKSSALAKRMKDTAIPVGVEFARDELHEDDLAGLFSAGAIVAIA